MLCFYHSSDMDGFCSAAIVKYKKPECELRPINYGQEFPWGIISPDEIVFMVDFTLQPFKDMIRLKDSCSLIWIDHHKSALEEAERLSFTASFGQNCRIGSAGCELTWEYCFPDREMPKSVFLLGRYDVWNHEHTGVLEFQQGIRLHNSIAENSLFWKELFEDDNLTDSIIEQGKILIKYNDLQNEIYCKSYAFEVEFEGLRCIAVNRGMTNTLIFKSIWNSTKYDAMIIFCMMKTGQWKVTLATTPENESVDILSICKKFGGGGHKEIGGFQVDCLPW